MAPLCARAGVPLFANDRPDLALLARCSGVHLGRDDVPAPLARVLAVASGSPPEAPRAPFTMGAQSEAEEPPSRWKLRVGLSAHDAESVDAALAEDPDYIALGPIFATQSKADAAPPMGLEVLGALASHIRRSRPGLPVVAIGGITVETAASVGAFVDCVAVISALLPEGAGSASMQEVSERARAIHKAIVGAQA
jgi:thiamine-phosphate pyrophosphorylase